MKIELKSIRHYPSMSEETNCYEASLWINGRMVGKVSNRGTGGPDEFTGDWTVYKEADEWCRANLPPHTYDDGEGCAGSLPMDLELVCGELLDAHLVEKSMVTAMRTKALFTKPGEQGLFVLGYKRKGAKPDELLFAEVRKANPDAVILNELPLPEALAIYRSQSA